MKGTIIGLAALLLLASPFIVAAIIVWPFL